MAQSASLQMGARLQGLGYSSACVSDVWSMTANAAGLAETSAPVVTCSYDAVPSFKSFNRMAAVVALPIGRSAAGLSTFRFGDDLYNEHVISLGFANNFGLAALGVKGNCIQYRAEGLATRTLYTVSFGGLATITPKFLFGAHIVNINQPVINDVTGERIPTRLIAGICLKPSERLSVCSEIEKHLEHAPVIKAGIEYTPFKKIAFRTGFNFRPEAAFFGVGFNTTRIEISYAMQASEALGLSHQATATLPFRR